MHIKQSQYNGNIVFSQTIRTIGLQFHENTPYDKLAKIHTKLFGHMAKMAAMPIYGKNLLTPLLGNQKASDLMTWYSAFGMWGLPSLFK